MLGTRDLCLPPAAPNEPPALIINIHGGAFAFGDKAMEARNIAAQQAAGYAAAHAQPRSTGDLWSR
jgi:acetyl esterase/lipase